MDQHHLQHLIIRPSFQPASHPLAVWLDAQRQFAQFWRLFVILRCDRVEFEFKTDIVRMIAMMMMIWWSHKWIPFCYFIVNLHTLLLLLMSCLWTEWKKKNEDLNTTELLHEKQLMDNNGFQWLAIKISFNFIKMVNHNNLQFLFHCSYDRTQARQHSTLAP